MRAVRHRADALFARFVAGTVCAEQLSIAERRAVHLRVLSEATHMPLYDFKCDDCGHVQEHLFASLQAAVQDPVLCSVCHAITMRQPSAPASVVVEGFNAMNGYSPARTIRQRHGNGIVTEVKGNFEAFSDGLHK